MQVIPCNFLSNTDNQQFNILVDGVPAAVVTHREIEILDENRQIHEFGGHGWNVLVQAEHLIAGTRVVFTNLLNNAISLMPFDVSGLEMRSERVPRMPLNWTKPFMRSPIDEGILIKVHSL